MSDQYVHLIGAEDIRRAGANIDSAATNMNRAAANFDSSVYRLIRFMDDWLMRFEQIIDKQKEG